MGDPMRGVREKAFENIEELYYEVRETPIETLMTIDFENTIGGHVSQREYAHYNLKLDSRSCLGSAAQSAAIVEKHFPEAKLSVAEVWEDMLANKMIELLESDRRNRFDPTFMRELLMYEEPHFVIVVDGVQFDPLCLQYGQEITHPRIKEFKTWEGITASVFVSAAWLTSDLFRKLNILRTAKDICNEMVLIHEGMCAPLELFEEEEELRESMMYCYKNRPCARTLYVIYKLTNEKKYYQKLVDKYTGEVLKYIV